MWYNLEVELIVPQVVSVFCLKNNVVCCIGIDKQRVHRFVVTVKPLEVYKGKLYNICWQSYQEAREIKWLQRGYIDRECFISTLSWTYMLLHFEKMGLAIFTTNTLYKHNFRAHLPSYKYLFHLLSLYYFLLEVNLFKNGMIKAISQIKK